MSDFQLAQNDAVYGRRERKYHGAWLRCSARNEQDA